MSGSKIIIPYQEHTCIVETYIAFSSILSNDTGVAFTDTDKKTCLFQMRNIETNMSIFYVTSVSCPFAFPTGCLLLLNMILCLIAVSCNVHFIQLQLFVSTCRLFELTSCSESKFDMSLLMRKPTICICENKDADQLCSNCTADQLLCFRHTDSTIPLLLISKVLRCDCTAWFVSDLVGNTNCLFSHAQAHIL